MCWGVPGRAPSAPLPSAALPAESSRSHFRGPAASVLEKSGGRPGPTAAAAARRCAPGPAGGDAANAPSPRGGARARHRSLGAARRSGSPEAPRARRRPCGLRRRRARPRATHPDAGSAGSRPSGTRAVASSPPPQPGPEPHEPQRARSDALQPELWRPRARAAVSAGARVPVGPRDGSPAPCAGVTSLCAPGVGAGRPRRGNARCRGSGLGRGLGGL